MPTNNLLDTSTVSLSDIIGNGKTYQVPQYQRDYSWKEEHWEDLWEDIINILEGEKVHYMGSIVLQNRGDKKYDIIDGQQRLATLTLIVLAVIQTIQNIVDKNIDQENNKERIILLTKKFLGDKDPGSLTYSSKLVLNKHNDSFFQSHLMVFRPPINEKTLIDSDKLLWKAYNYFFSKVSEYFVGREEGKSLADFINKEIAEKLKFIQIVVEDELSAYTVFETLNSRGETLSISDLLKNFLFSLAAKADMRHIEEQWRRIIDIIGLDRFPTFLRHYWISKNRLINEKRLFKALKEQIKTSPQVIDLLDDLEKNAQLYTALSNYSDNFWTGEREIKKRIKEIELFGEKQALPILMAAYNNLSKEEFEKVLRIISVITFRYTVIAGRNPNVKEKTYNEASVLISANKLTAALSIADIIKPLYRSDEEFKNDFSTIIINTARKKSKKLVRYILTAIENHLSQTDHDFEALPATIEHILPENADNNLPDNNLIDDFPISIQEAFIYRIGNYTLLEDDKNKECGTKSFELKKEIYKTSQYKLSNEINFNQWTPNTLEIRQRKLADYASAVWRVSQYNTLKKF